MDSSDLDPHLHVIRGSLGPHESALPNSRARELHQKTDGERA